MFKEVLAPFAVLPVVSLVIFFSLLCLVCLWIWRPNSNCRYELISRSLFDESEVSTHVRK